LERAKRYSEVQSKHFHKSWIDVGLFTDDKEAMRIMFDIPFNEQDLHQEVLSKLKRDIATEYFGLDELKHLK
jgi:hypothetical protein